MRCAVRLCSKSPFGEETALPRDLPPHPTRNHRHNKRTTPHNYWSGGPLASVYLPSCVGLAVTKGGDRSGRVAIGGTAVAQARSSGLFGLIQHSGRIFSGHVLFLMASDAPPRRVALSPGPCWVGYLRLACAAVPSTFSQGTVHI